jgi:hypothetical protein
VTLFTSILTSQLYHRLSSSLSLIFRSVSVIYIITANAKDSHKTHPTAAKTASTFNNERPTQPNPPLPPSPFPSPHPDRLLLLLSPRHPRGITGAATSLRRKPAPAPDPMANSNLPRRIIKVRARSVGPEQISRSPPIRFVVPSPVSSDLVLLPSWLWICAGDAATAQRARCACSLSRGFGGFRQVLRFF